MPLAFYLSDLGLFVLSLAALPSALAQGRGQIVRRWTLLLPGVLTSLASVANIAFPRAADLANLTIWLIGVLGFLIGSARAQFMGMDSDQNWGLVRMRWGKDLLWVTVVFVLFALIHVAIEMSFQEVSPLMPTGVLGMTLAGSYLLGRSVVGWIRAGRKNHTDLRD